MDASLSIAGAAADAAAVGNLKSALDETIDNVEDLQNDIYSEVKKTFSHDTVITTSSIGNTTHLIDFDPAIPSGTTIIYRITDPSNIMPSNITVYVNGTSIGSGKKPNVDYEYTAVSNISYFSIYCTGISNTGTITFGVDYTVHNTGTIEEKIEELKDEIYSDVEKSYSHSTPISTASINATTHLIDFNPAIPAGTEITYRINDPSNILPSSFSVYANGTSIGSGKSANTDYTFEASSALSYMSIYCTGITLTGTIEFVVNCTIHNDDSTGSRVAEVESAFAKIELYTDNLENGSIANATGKDFDSADRVRTKIYIPMRSGQVVKSSSSLINVFEYNIDTFEYIRNANDWVTSYTVQNDCYIRILWNDNQGKTYQQLIDDVSFNASVIRGVALDGANSWKYFKNGIESCINDNTSSTTIKTIAHRGDDITAPQCTLPAYISARRRGIMIGENDLWLSEDNQFVMWHDDTLGKLDDMVDINGYLMYTDGTDYYYVRPSDNAVFTWNGSSYSASSKALSSLTRCNGSNYGVNSTYNVIGLPLSVLKRIDFGVYKGAQFAGTQILTFEEWVFACKKLGMGIYIDHKLAYTNELLTNAATIVKRAGMSEYSAWLGLDVNQCRLLRSLIPRARIGNLNNPDQTLVDAFAEFKENHGFFFDGNGKTITLAEVQLALDAGYDCEVWYVDVGAITEEQVLTNIRNLVDLGVTGMTLDYYKVDDAYKYLLE